MRAQEGREGHLCRLCWKGLLLGCGGYGGRGQAGRLVRGVGKGGGLAKHARCMHGMTWMGSGRAVLGRADLN